MGGKKLWLLGVGERVKVVGFPAEIAGVVEEVDAAAGLALIGLDRPCGEG